MAESSVTTSNPTKGMQKFLGIGVFGGLEKRIGNNEKKITKITSILKLRKENVGKNLKGEDINSENLAERLNNIAQTLAVLTRALKQQLITQKRSAAANQQNIDDQKKRDREKDLEKQKAKQSRGGGTGKVANAIKTPFIGIFDAAKRFFGNIVAGSAVLGFLKWLKNVDEQGKFDDFIKSLQDKAGGILVALLAIAAIPLAATLLNVVGAVIVGVGLLKGALAAIFSPAGLIALGVAAGFTLVKVGSDAWVRLFTGGKQLEEARKKLGVNYGLQVRELNKNTNSELIMDERPLATWLVDRETGGVKRSKNWTLNGKPNPGWTGTEEGSTGREIIFTPNTLKADGTYWGTPGQRAIVNEYNRKMDIIGEPGQGIQKKMWDEIRAARKGVKEERFEGQKNLGGSELSKYQNETVKLQKEAEKRVSAKYAILLQNLIIGPKDIKFPTINQPLGGEGSVNFLPLGDTSSGGGASSSVEGGNNVPSFSSSSGKVGNQFVLGVWNA